MADFHLIQGLEPKQIKTFYSCYETFEVEINYSRYNFDDLPTITKYRIENSGENYDYADRQLKTYQSAANSNHMNGMYTGYNDVDSLFCILYEEDYLDVMLNSLKPARLYGNPKKVYRMKDGSLMTTYLVGKMYFQPDEPIKAIVKLMKQGIETAEKQFKDVLKQYNNKKREWNKVFLHYPQHSI